MFNNKKSFFRRKTSPLKSNSIYPPYYEKKEDFLKCLECEIKECISSCDEKIIHIDNEIPIIKFGINGCTFCDECAIACPENVLKVENRHNKLNCEFIINMKTCLAWNKTVCFSCQDICNDNAISFNGLFNPIIDEEKCTNCGFCLSVCPANSIEWSVK